jgi:anion-transporting  ArsA/GET3 family ATPase
MNEAALQLDAPPTLVSLVESRRILVTVGSGGVGKTTTAAALGLLAARRGRRTLVMTIDPARRLATSLGLESLDDEQREVPADKLRSAGVEPGMLYAMMLDPKHTFDELVRRYAPDEQSLRQLLASRIYQEISGRLAGAQEYAAMEKLHAIHLEGRYDMVVLDTPPTSNALDFLDAPQKMVDAVDSPAVSLLASVYRRAGKLSLGALGLGAAFVVRRLARLTGGPFLDDIAGFLADLSGLLGGLRDRAAQVLALLARPDVGFIVVASPDPSSIDEASVLCDRLARSRMSPSGFVINKVHPLRDVTVSNDELVAEIERVLGVGGAARLAQVLLDGHALLQLAARADAVQIARLAQSCGRGRPVVQVPLFDEDVHDVDGLMRLAGQLGVEVTSS